MPVNYSCFDSWLTTKISDRSHTRRIIVDEEEDSTIEKALDLCRKVLIALLVFLGLLYYVTYEYDEALFDADSDSGKVLIFGQK
jgi:hypothetical protein